MMNLLRIALYEIVYYGWVPWFAFIAITFVASRYFGWAGALLSPVVVAVTIGVLDVRWIFDQMQHHPEEGRDADIIFMFGVMCRILVFSAVLLPVSWAGLRLNARAGLARPNKTEPNQTPEPTAPSGRGSS